MRVIATLQHYDNSKDLRKKMWGTMCIPRKLNATSSSNNCICKDVIQIVIRHLDYLFKLTHYRMGFIL